MKMGSVDLTRTLIASCPTQKNRGQRPRLRKILARFYCAGFQLRTKSRHWVISGTLVSQLCSYSQWRGPG